MAEGGSDTEMVLEEEYQRAVAALGEAGLSSLLPFVKEQGLKDEVLLSLESEEALKEFLDKKLQPFIHLWFQKYSVFATPRSFGAKAEEIFYEVGSKLNITTENREAEFKSFRFPPPCAAPQNSELTWKMMEKAKSFICGCLNAVRKGIIYFGVGDKDREILGLEITHMMNEINTAFQQVLSYHIKSDTGGLLNVEEQDGINLHFIQVKRQGCPTGLHVIEIEVERIWMSCEDKVYYSKTWGKQKNDNNSRAGSGSHRSLKDYFQVQDGWDDAQVRLCGITTKVKHEEVYEKVKKPLQKKYREWEKKKDYQGDSFSSLTDELIEEARNKVVTEPMINGIYQDVAPFWKNLAKELGIDHTRCVIIDKDENEVQEKAMSLCLKWIHSKASQATVGRLVDALVNIGEKIIADKLLAEAAKETK